MKELKFGMMYDQDIIKYIRDITGESSSLKREIFKTTVMKKSLDKKVCNDFLTAVNEFLRFWDEYSQDLHEKIKATTGTEGVITIDYQYVKEFIYAKYDYASVLPFADGIIKGVTSGKFTTTDDIEDFRDHTISKAFDNQADSSAALLDSVLVSGGGIGSINGSKPVSTLEAKMFDSIRNYDMFNRRNRPELYKAITEIVKFMTIDIGMGKYIDTSDIKMFVSIINNIVDYITYSLTAYATRIYIISAYAYPFIQTNGKPEIVSESVIHEDVNSDVDLGANEVRVFIDADEMICRDPAKTKEFFAYFDPFLKIIGADVLFGSHKPTYKDHFEGMDTLGTTSFCSKLVSNPLHDFLTGRRDSFLGFNDTSESSIMELQQILKSYIYNNNQGIQGESSPKQEIFHVIRGTTCDGTLKGYQTLAKDLYLCAIHLCCGTESWINDIIRWKSEENHSPKYNTGTLNSAAESLKILSEFYRDLTSAILQKARDIELNVNVIRSEEVNKTIAGINIQIPNQKNDVDTNNNLMTAVPDTTRMPTELIDLYDVPTLECMEMYNEYVRSLPGMEDDIFYSEAFNIAAIFDAIIAGIQNAWKRFRQFWSNKDVQRSIKWIMDHEKELGSMDFSAGSMKVHNYKPAIGLPKNFNNLSNGLVNFDPDKIKTEKNVSDFISSLYPSPAIYSWFTGDENKDGKSGPIKYRNHILFYDEGNTKVEIPEDVSLSGADIQKRVMDWIKTVKDVKAVNDQMEQMGKTLETGIKSIRTKMITSTTDATNKPNSVTPPPTPGSTATGSSNTGTSAVGDNTDKNNQEAAPLDKIVSNPDNKKEEANNSNLSTAVLNDIQITVKRISSSLSPIFIDYIKTMYEYLKEAYTVGRKR